MLYHHNLGSQKVNIVQRDTLYFDLEAKNIWEIYLYSGALRGTIINSVVDSCYQSMYSSKSKISSKSKYSVENSYLPSGNVAINYLDFGSSLSEWNCGGFSTFLYFFLDYRTKLTLSLYQNLVIDEREVIP